MAGSKLKERMEIDHVTAMASTSSRFSRPLAGLEAAVRALARLQLGVDVMQVHLAVATAPCMANTVEIATTMGSGAPIEAEQETHIANGAQTGIVGASVLAVRAILNLDCPRQARKWSIMIPTFGQERSRVRTAKANKAHIGPVLIVPQCSVEPCLSVVSRKQSPSCISTYG